MRIRTYFRVGIIAAGISLGCASFCQTDQTKPEQRLQWYEQHLDMKESSIFQGLEWQFIGPTNISGRMTDVAVVQPKGLNYTIYVAGASGGVWRTQNEGITWEPIFEQGISTSLGDITLAPSDPDIIWIGTGEANIFRSSHAGAGVYKSTDRGENWTHMGLTGTHTIPRIIIHPQDPDIVYVASSGHEWTDNEERGLYLSKDGGTSWEKIFYVDDRTGVIDLVMHPDDPNVLYLSTWQRVRKKWNDPRVENWYDKSSIFRTADGGITWTEVTNGLPQPEHRGRIGIDISKSNPEVLYAFIDNYEFARMPEEGQLDSYGRPAGPIIRGATVFRTDDGGNTWRQVSENGPYMERISNTYGWVFGQIRVDPNDPDKIFVMGVRLHMSEDGGQSFRTLDGMHGDHHGMWIDPSNSDYIVNVNDGGVAITYDGGENWRTFYDNLPLVQFFNVSYDLDEPFHVVGSIQDHGSYRGLVDLSRGRNQIPAVEYERAPGGEGTRHAIDPTNPNMYYASTFYGRLQRTDISTDESTSILPQPREGEVPFRGQWLAATILSPHNPWVVYHGMNFLFRSLDRGESWERISPDLSYNDPEKYGDIPHQTIVSIAESHFQFGKLFVGTDDGRLHKTGDHGKSWTELTDRIPVEQWVVKIVASEHTDGTVYVAQNGKRDDDFSVYLWKSTDDGNTWKDISGNIPCGPVNVIAEDPRNPDVLYVGTDISAYVSLDGGSSWHVLAGGLPSTFVHDIIVHPREDILVAATHGRGMFAMDARPIQELTSDVLTAGLHIFEPAKAQAPRGSFRDFSMVPATVYFYLQSAAEVELQILDSNGNTVHQRKVQSTPGINSVSWNLRNERDDGESGGGRRGRGANFVDPGSYTCLLSAGSVRKEVNLEVTR